MSSSISKFNPHSQSYVSQGRDGRFENKSVGGSGIISNTPKPKPEPTVLSQKSTAAPVVKTIY